MDPGPLADLVGPALAEALAAKGYVQLTPIQEAVLDPELAGRDLRLSSQTGSGKTLAIGFAIADLVERHQSEKGGAARPAAIIVTPTRELAKQVEQELSWLYAPLRARVTSVTGGASYRDEHRALAADPAVVVGTPGRLLDHLTRGSIDGKSALAIVLDEADRMFDMGFRDELTSIFELMPDKRRTHLMSATFPREVKGLADRVQQNPAHVEGTPLGAVHADIEHVVHLVHADERVDAIVNLLLANAGEQTLIFARTRADVAALSAELEQTGFAVASLSGEMEQRARNRALTAFKRGELRALVATDVAARGIDVQGIARVIHAEPPTDADSYTHRSGRTGRAGRKGTSSILVGPRNLARTAALLGRLGISFRFEPIPGPEEIRSGLDERWFSELTAPDPEGFTGFDPRTWALASRLTESKDVTRVVARLLTAASHAGPTEPRELTPLEPPRRPDRSHAGPPARDSGKRRPDAFVPFRVSWGGRRGADPRRLLALVCRRGDIRGSDVGSIRVEENFSIVEVSRAVAEGFARAAAEPDPRDSRVTIVAERPRSGGPTHANRREGPRGAGPTHPKRQEGPRGGAPAHVKRHEGPRGRGAPPRGKKPARPKH